MQQLGSRQGAVIQQRYPCTYGSYNCIYAVRAVDAGAYNKMAKLPAEARARGVITSSAGNHAQGVALAASRMVGADNQLAVGLDGIRCNEAELSGYSWQLAVGSEAASGIMLSSPSVTAFAASQLLPGRRAARPSSACP